MSLPIGQSVDAAIEHQVRMGDLAPGSLAVYVPIWQQFVRYATASGAPTASEVTGAVVRDFLLAETLPGTVPAAKTQRNRYSALKRLFACLRAIGAAAHDPTLDITLPALRAEHNRPLEDREVEDCRWASRRNVAATRLAAVWALREAGAVHTELPLIIRCCIDLDAGLVLLPGSPRTGERVVPLTEWGSAQLGVHLAATHPGPDQPVVYAGPGASGRLSTMSHESRRVLELAGLDGDPTVGPSSVRAWLGLKVWNETRSIEKVAGRLGLRSTDLAYKVIGIDWWDFV